MEVFGANREVSMIQGMSEKLKRLRKEKGLSLKEVASAIGFSSTGIISDYECGHKSPSLSALSKLSILYGVSTDYLLGIDNDEKLIIDVSGLSERQKISILSVIDAMKPG